MPDDKATDPSSNPLFGATRPSPETTKTPPSDPKISTSSPTPLSPPQAPTAPITPPRPSLPLSNRIPPPIPKPSIQTYLKRLTSLLSIVLGTSALITLTWSYFLLPLLHSSFSARQTKVAAQTDRMTHILIKVKGIRNTDIYPQSKLTTPPTPTHTTEPIDEKGIAEDIRIHPVSIPPGFTTLTTSLQDLTNALSSTATTRTSLLSTLESYTSYLHRQIYLRNNHTTSSGGRFGLSVGLGSLGEKLSKEGGGEGLGRGMEEWDAVRKEVRGVKGLLLGRRNFSGVGA